MTHPDTLQRAAFEDWVMTHGSYPRRPDLKSPDGRYHYDHTEREWGIWQAALRPQATPPVGQVAGEPHTFNEESPFCVKCGSTGEDADLPVAHILPRMLKILKFKSMPVPVDPLPYDNGEETTVPLYTKPQPTPDTAEAIRLALDALNSCSQGGYRDVDGDWCKRYTFDVVKRDAAIAALEKVK